ncbi:SDR family NAD(P)-dependent oxidoreductase [Guyparkeria hydrothermalis]|uniref:SDR family NAD(P)-dependent oxidoreductase n=1 Tax=Guyparkeria hydrothermalis TaxID=923 RepID=UPI0020212E7B|nr:SDR family NAD(P)-dependent oxidoreductase [Guyparkeria hydrothermalis]MCL7745101.1 SDR family NAD(P)-dependent oxidoreductase [Guyparkeria hydrothermalis]
MSRPRLASVPRRVLITGCSSGIGRCAAEQLAERGHHVVASMRGADDLAAWPHEHIPAVRLDLDDPASIREGLAAAEQLAGGPFEVLFNNGAYGQPGAVEDLGRDTLRAQLETNLLGTVELTNLVIPAMREAGFGRIVQNSSVLGVSALAFRGAYVASKFALEGISDTMRLELAGSGIEVSLIEPGPISSRFRANAQRAFEANIDWPHSVHREAYERQLERLRKPGPAAPFTLPPEAVVRRLIHAIEARRPKARYPVTVPTYLFGVLKRLLTTRAMDRVLARASGGGKR